MPFIAIGNRVGKSSGQSWSQYWTTRYPTVLTLVNDSATQFTLRWVNGSKTDFDGFKIYKSIDNGLNYTVHETINEIVNFRTLSGLSVYTHYLFYVVAFKGTHESDQTNVVDNTLADTTKTVAWFIADQLDTITKDGGTNEVSAWNDKLGSGHNLTQSTALKKPIWSADGVLFDGSNDLMKTASFTLIQPTFVYIVLKQVTWTLNDRFFDGYTKDTTYLFQAVSSPQIKAVGGSSSHTQTKFMNIDQFAVIRTLFDGANGFFQVNSWPKVAANLGTANFNGFTLGANGNGTAAWSNIQVKEVIVRKVSDNADTHLAIATYLKNKYSVDWDEDRVPMFSFIVDDVMGGTYGNAYEWLFPTLESLGLKGGFAINTAQVGLEGAMTWLNIQEIQAAGHEILSHTITHPDLTTLSEADLITELNGSKLALEAQGLTVSNLVYPGGSYNATVVGIADDYYEAAFQVGVAQNVLPLNKFAIVRCAMYACALADMLRFVDEVIAANGDKQLIFYTHSYGMEQQEKDDFITVMNYIKSRGYILKTPKQMIDTIKTYSLNTY